MERGYIGEENIERGNTEKRYIWRGDRQERKIQKEKIQRENIDRKRIHGKEKKRKGKYGEKTYRKKRDIKYMKKRQIWKEDKYKKKITYERDSTERKLYKVEIYRGKKILYIEDTKQKENNKEKRLYGEGHYMGKVLYREETILKNYYIEKVLYKKEIYTENRYIWKRDYTGRKLY